jgi:hypothetical protein
MRLRKGLKLIVLVIASIAPWLTGCKVVCREPECPFFEPESRDQGAARDIQPGTAEDESLSAGTTE